MKCIAAILFLVAVQLNAATLNVTNYGAFGNAIRTNTFNAVSNSAVVTTTATLSAADVGKVISIFGAGPRLTATNSYSDVIAFITGVSAATNVTLDRVVSNTTNGAYAIYGTLCSTGFQACVNAVAAGDTISIPAGNYLMIPAPLIATNYVGDFYTQIPAVTISKGGIRFVGANQTNTILTGNGAWRLYPAAVVRGFIFSIVSPITNSYELPFGYEGLTFDGGVLRGRTSYQGFPANDDGDGWDVTHGAIIAGGASPPFHTNTSTVNCTFRNWRGEMLKTGYDYQSSNFSGFTNCTFRDGNASAINWQIGGHVIQGCYFSNVITAQEFYTSVSLLPCYFQNSTITNCDSGMSLVGAQTDRQPQAPYMVRSNNIQATQWGINLSPAQNVTIRGNYFHDLQNAVLLGGAGGQGSASISNIVVIENICSNALSMMLVFAGSHIYVTNNLLHGGDSASEFANGGSNNQRGNAFYYNNRAYSVRGGLNFSANSEGLPYDDPSNLFTPKPYDDFAPANTNLVSYSFGYRQNIRISQAGSVWRADDLIPTQIPPMAVMLVSNVTGGTINFYSSATNSVTPDAISNNGFLFYYWSGTSWGTNRPPDEWRIGTLTIRN